MIDLRWFVTTHRLVKPGQGEANPDKEYMYMESRVLQYRNVTKSGSETEWQDVLEVKEDKIIRG